MTQAARAAAARTRRPRRDTARRRAERAQRILDAAAELVLRLGYDKTTIDDVARRAGVAKGTIYLHWAGREELFAALLRRERAGMVAEVRAQVRADPAAASPQGVFAHVAGELFRRPLLRGVLVNDPEVMGKLAHMKRQSGTTAEMLRPFETYLGALRRHGLVREDLSLADHVALIGSIMYGALISLPLLPEAYQVSDERAGELIGDTLARALGTGRKASAEERRASEAATLEFLDSVHEVAQHKLRLSLGDPAPGDPALGDAALGDAPAPEGGVSS